MSVRLGFVDFFSGGSLYAISVSLSFWYLCGEGFVMISSLGFIRGACVQRI